MKDSPEFKRSSGCERACVALVLHAYGTSWAGVVNRFVCGVPTPFCPLEPMDPGPEEHASIHCKE